MEAIGNEAKFRSVVASGKVVALCSATWCRACKQLTPKLERLAKELGDSLTFIKLDQEELPDVLMEHNVTALPTLLFFDAGALTKSFAGNKFETAEKHCRAFVADAAPAGAAPMEEAAAAAPAPAAGQKRAAEDASPEEPAATRPALGAGDRPRELPFGLELLLRLGLPDVAASANDVLGLNTIVADVLALPDPQLSSEDMDALLRYRVPKLSPEGTCSVGDDLEDTPFDLSCVLPSLPSSPAAVPSSPAAVRLHRLKLIMSRLRALATPDWLGVYRAVPTPAGQGFAGAQPSAERCLVKEAYEGEPSRALFPLTEAFAEGSANSRVGLTGRAVAYEDVGDGGGEAEGYYKCSAKVRSELCVPILDASGAVVGIIDAESWTPGHFSATRTLEIIKVARDLGASPEFYLP